MPSAILGSIKSLISFSRESRRITLSKKDRIAFYRKMDSLLGNGLRMIHAVTLIRSQAERQGKRSTVRLCRKILRSIRTGSKLSDALGNSIPMEERMILASGEQSGDINFAIKRIIDYMEGGKEIQKAIIGGVTYPAFLMIMIIAMIYGFGLYIVPIFSTISDPRRWTGTAASLYQISEFLKVGWYIMPLVITITLTIFFLSLRYLRGHIRIILDRYPPYSIYRAMQGSNFIVGLGALMNAGIQSQKAVMMLRESSISNPWLRERIDGILRGIRLGHNPGAAMFQAGFEFPDRDLVEELAVYATMPGFPEELLRIGREWTQDVTANVKSSMNFLNGLATVIVGLVVMWLSTGMFSVSQQISSTMGMH